ncbi:MAG: substrate-binding domain-containing protein [Pseudomonadota bacterium]
MRLVPALVCAVSLVACGESGLSQFDGQPIPPPPPIGEADRIKIVGSSTVAPFSTAVAEQFGAATRYATPIVETTGTGGGFKAFCRAVGADEPSISNASRRIKASEIDLCAQAGIHDIVEIKIGYDGIVLANAKSGPAFDFTKAEIYRALAAELPDGKGGWVRNRYERWSDIAQHLPDKVIQVAGPPPTSGTRDAFVEIAMEKGAETIPELAALKSDDEAQFKRRAHTIRTDGRWIDSGENDAAIIQTLIKNPDAVGVLGYSFLDTNGDRIKASRIDGVSPTFEAITSGDYRISRSMYLYVKEQNVPVVPGLVGFIDAFTQDDAWGPAGYLADEGLIPLNDTQRRAVRQTALALQTVTPEP